MDVLCRQRSKDLMPAVVFGCRLPVGFRSATSEQRELVDGVWRHCAAPKASCSTTPAREQGSSV
jgi:hypothetical protein